jgi:LL-diaminopimelate aminotransferase
LGNLESHEIKPADRIANIKPYFFASLNQQLVALKARGVDIIRVDIGSPDLPPAEYIIDTLVSEVRRSDTHGYSPNGGSLDFRKAVAEYYGNRFEVDLDPDREVIGLIGSKEGIFNLNQVLINPGDLVFIPDPSYPVYKAGGIIAGAEVYPLKLMKENNFLPDFEIIPEAVKQNGKLLWLNYPNNPTGAVATIEFFGEAVYLARKYGWIIAHDAPYADVCFDQYVAPSILQIPGAKNIAVEFNSLSKAYNMAGWRLGMAVGNSQIISYLRTYKSQMDSSHFSPIISAGVKALTGDQSWIYERNKIYQNRRDIVVNSLREAGLTVSEPKAAIYVWAQLPGKNTDSTTFCSKLLNDTGVSATPGIVYGDCGAGFIRISLGIDTVRLTEAMQRIVIWSKASLQVK